VTLRARTPGAVELDAATRRAIGQLAAVLDHNTWALVDRYTRAVLQLPPDTVDEARAQLLEAVMARHSAGPRRVRVVQFDPDTGRAAIMADPDEPAP
jgi:hypothetical protein